MTSSLMVEVALLELKLLTCQILNGGWKSMVNHTHNGKSTHKLFSNIIFMYLVLLKYFHFKILSFEYKIYY